jgi:hypothetical protein
MKLPENRSKYCAYFGGHYINVRYIDRPIVRTKYTVPRWKVKTRYTRVKRFLLFEQKNQNEPWKMKF